MSSKVQYLHKRGLINPPSHVLSGIQYETIMGSGSYGVSDDLSDIDIYGFSIPNKDMIFPHLRGEIPGFGKQIKRFEQYQQHHVKDQSSQKEYDLTIYSIIKFFQLCMDNNPNMVDSLFTPQRCVLYQSRVGNLVRENRKLFLSKKVFHSFKGYAYSQLHKIDRNPEGKRKELVEKYGWDLKFGYHVVRLLLEVEQILVEGDLDLERNREQLKAIRRGEWSLDQVKDFFNEKERVLEEVYNTSNAIPYSPSEEKIKDLLLVCLEEHFGSLSEAIKLKGEFPKFIMELEDLIQKYKI